jgi:dTDP-4-dehydrorhamnose reductase|tara:strand:+ start:1066 stop:1989 length:924 start_codon:yes stop_codon:yes gene_type:complete
MKKKILIFGGSGLLGSNYIRSYSKKHMILATYFNNKLKYSKSSNIKSIKLDIKMSYQKILLKLKSFKPDYIFNFSGISDIDYCENNKRECHNVIFNGLKKIIKISKNYKAYLIHISTDSLFNNNKKFKSENSKLVPLNYYSKLKIQCEKYLLKNYNNHLIVRTRFFGFSFKKQKNNFFEQILEKLKKKQIIYCYDNVFSTPIGVQNLVTILDKLSDIKLIGIFNIVSNERISRYRFAHKVAKIFKLNEKLIMNAKYIKKKQKMKKLLDTSLSNLKIQKKLKFKIEKINESLKNLKNEKKNSSYSSSF